VRRSTTLPLAVAVAAGLPLACSAASVPDGAWGPAAAGARDAGAAGQELVCASLGIFCGGHGVAAGDPSTLYVCAAKGAKPVSSSSCLAGCVYGDAAPDRCAIPDGGDGQPACPGGGLVCGGHQMDGDPGTLYACPGAGLPPTSSTKCANGCQLEAPGTNDLCASAVLCPAPGDFCGGHDLSGDPDTLYHCGAGGVAPQASQACPNGCAAGGQNDACRSTLSCPGAGDFCGANGVQGGDAGTLYHCPGAAQPPSGSQPCVNGCTIEPSGTNDFCAATGLCPTAGDYCGNDMLGGPADVLYHCAGAGQPPSSNTVCAGGCVVEQMGQADVCAGGGGCSAAGQSALHWEANQLNTGNSWSDFCLAFVESAYQNAGLTLAYLQEADASSSLQAAENTGSFVPWNGNCPCGAILYWSANQCNGEWGHVVICNGDGTVSTSGWPNYDGSTAALISWLDGEECGNTPAGYVLP